MWQQHFSEARLKYKGQTFEHDFLEYLAGNPCFLTAPEDLSTAFYFPFFFSPKSDFTFPQLILFILVLLILLFYKLFTKLAFSQLSTDLLHLSVEVTAGQIPPKLKKNGHI